MATLSNIMNAAREDKPDILFCISTPALQAALNNAGDLKIVFTGVADGVLAGAGNTSVEHLPNVTGITTSSAFADMASALRKIMPNAKKIGTLFSPSEVNSVRYKDLFSRALADEGLELISVPVYSSADIAQPATSLCAQKIDAVCQILDDTTRTGSQQIVRTATNAHLPVFGFEARLVKGGAVMAVSRSYVDAGIDAGTLALRVLNGTSPASIPFVNVKTETVQVNVDAAAHNNIVIPTDLLAKARTIYGIGARLGRPAKVALVNMADNAALEDARKGVIEGLCDKGLVEGKDFVVKDYNAHGELSMLPQILDAAKNDGPDLIVPIGTPTVQALAKKGSPVPAVFTVDAEPVKSGTDGAVRDGWLTGVYLNTPVRELVEMTLRRCPGIKKVGVIYNPGEFISNAAVEKMRDACKKNGLTLEERAIGSATEAQDAAHALVAAKVEAILTSSDSIMHACLPAVVNITRPAGIPIFANETELIPFGATASIGYSFEDWGRASGQKAAQVLAGLKPGDIPPAALSKDYLHEVDADTHASAPQDAPVKVETPKPVVQNQPAATTEAPHKLWHIRVVAYNDTAIVDDLKRGVSDGLKSEGLVEGKDYELRDYNAQGDIATLTSIMTSVRSDNADLLFCLTTPALQAGLRQAGDVKKVFCGIANAVAAGAGKSATDHQPNVTGIVTQCDFDTMIKLIRRTLPNAKRVGTLFSPSETNSVFYKDLLEKALKAEGIELVAVPVNSSSETVEGAAALCAKNLDLVCQILDNTTRIGFPQIVKKANEAGLPTYCFDKGQFKEGAVIAVAYDYHDSAVEAGKLGARILRGEDPSTMPFIRAQSPKILINEDAAKAHGIAIPPELLK